MTNDATTDTFAREVAALRPWLVSLARRSLRNEAWAEDAVSETLVAALEQRKSFGGRAAARTWVVGILKHKLIDQVRRHTRECQLEAAQDEEPDFDSLLPAAGESEAPSRRGDPIGALARRQFIGHLEAILAQMPAKQVRAFVLCDGLEHDTGEVCRALGVTPNHLGVILHRARTRLRAAVSAQWRGAAPLLA